MLWRPLAALMALVPAAQFPEPAIQCTINRVEKHFPTMAKAVFDEKEGKLLIMGFGPDPNKAEAISLHLPSIRPGTYTSANHPGLVLTYSKSAYSSDSKTNTEPFGLR